jgi:hypothetical protein
VMSFPNPTPRWGLGEWATCLGCTVVVGAIGAFVAWFLVGLLSRAVGVG